MICQNPNIIITTLNKLVMYINIIRWRIFNYIYSLLQYLQQKLLEKAVKHLGIMVR